jgi:ATP-dependent DNA helicase RecG
MPCAQIELVWFNTHEEEGADVFEEKIFKGPLFRQVKDALDYIKNQIIVERVVKVAGRAEADRFFNFPYEALEEALANACQHKSYQIPEPIEIRIYLNRIMIINYPGPEPWIDIDEFREGKAVSRRYRNRRIGELFQEIDLAEKKSTGITKILRTLARNGSPPPTFKTDSERHSLETTIWIHEEFENIPENEQPIRDNVSVPNVPNVPNDKSEKSDIKDSEIGKAIVTNIKLNSSVSYDDLATIIGVTRKTIQRYVQDLKKDGILQRIGGTRGSWEIIDRDS